MRDRSAVRQRRSTDFQALQFRLADMATELEAARTCCAAPPPRSTPAIPSATQLCAMAKRFATDAGFEVANEALQLHGGYGYLADYGDREDRARPARAPDPRGHQRDHARHHRPRADRGAPMSDVIVERVGALGRLRLNRPKALNALTHGMVGAIDRSLDGFSADPGVAAVLLTGEGERGLCAGGDLRSLYESPDSAFAEAFWRDEYRLDARIAAYEKPFVAVMDGITMGGGVGLAGHAAHRIVTERSRIAMPETGIGYLPDVGGTWLLPGRRVRSAPIWA